MGKQVTSLLCQINAYLIKIFSVCFIIATAFGLKYGVGLFTSQLTLVDITEALKVYSSSVN
jgi:hypothetical protein